MEPLTTEQQQNLHQINSTQNSMMSQLSFSELLGQPNASFDFLQNTSIDSGRDSLNSNSNHSSPNVSEPEKHLHNNYSAHAYTNQYNGSMAYNPQYDYGFNYTMSNNYLMQPMYSYAASEQSNSPPFLHPTQYGNPVATPTTARTEYSSPLPSNVPTPGSKMSRKSPKKKKKKDPNEPNRPVSAYALFFRETQSIIKVQKPDATFGEISKIVASMWDGLGDHEKTVYKQKTENAKREYLRELAAYRASLVSCGPTGSHDPRGRKPY